MIKYLLFPITWLFNIIVFIRNTLYDYNILTSISSHIPIISVGNIQVGGTGKTPFVIALSKQLIANNIKPLIITRGYRRNTTNQIVFNKLNEYGVKEVGDEPYYMKKVLKTVPIIIDHNKKNAVKTANQIMGIDCILLDDGFQSRYINKNIDIVLISKLSRKYNFTLLPVGRLREPVSNLKRAHFIYTTKGLNAFKGHNFKHLKFTFKIIKTKNDNNQINNIEPMIAFCGIANSQYFISILKNMNIKIDRKIKFDNHAKYDSKKYKQLKNANPNNLSFITTYKDFVKLDESFKNKYIIYVLEMNLILNDNQLIKEIRQLIK